MSLPPRKVRAVVPEQAVAEAVGIQLRADARFDIVMHLDITDTVLPHETVDDLRIAEIKLIAVSV